MDRVLLIVLLAVLPQAGLSACVAHEAAPPGVETLKPAGQSLSSGDYIPGEVAVRLCANVGDEQIERVIKQHRLTIRKRTSPTIVVLAWEDRRPVEQVAGQISGESIFCIVQPNYRYNTQGGIK